MTLTTRSTTTASARDEWWKSAVVYQVYPRSFADSNGDGIGDLPGITSRLDHLRHLGVDVIWLSPIYASPHADNGYDISDYQDIDPLFGTLEDFDQLLSEVHAHGMKLVMDLVVNHTSDEHPWFVESRSSPDNPKRDWYWWRPPRPGNLAGEPGAEPTNWESFFSGSAWTLDSTTGEYYLHLFDRKQPDLNWESPELRRAIYSMMNWWLDRGVDGFRMDVINFISKNTDLPDGDVPPGGVLGSGFPHFATGPRIHEYLQEMRREVFDGRDGDYLTIGEMPGVTLEDAVLFTDPERRELDMVFQFEHVGLDHGPGGKFDPRPLNLRELKASLGRWQAGLGSRGWNSLYLNNHDQPRLVSRFGNDTRYWHESATALATVLHLHRGTPFIYQGEELGMTNGSFSAIEQMRDVESINYYTAATLQAIEPDTLMRGLQAMSRDNARTPMQWDDTPQAGFTSGSPWIEVNANHTWLNAEAQYREPGSIYHYYRQLVALRHSLPVVAHGDFTMLLEDSEHIYAFLRTQDTDQLLVVANLSDKEQQIDSAWAGAELVLSNYPPPDRRTLHLALAPWEARVYRRVTP